MVIDQYVEEYLYKATNRLAELSSEATDELERTGCRCDVSSIVDAILDINGSLFLIDKGWNYIDPTYGRRNYLTDVFPTGTERHIRALIDSYTVKYNMNDSSFIVYPLYYIERIAGIPPGQIPEYTTPNLEEVTSAGNYTSKTIRHADAVEDDESVTLGQVKKMSDRHYVHNQPNPAGVWTVIHNLEKFPSPVVVDSSGREVEGDIRHLDTNRLTITFQSSFSGKAYCN